MFTKYLELSLVVVLLPVGQLLWKYGISSMGVGFKGARYFTRILMLIANPYIWLGAIVYGITTFIWFGVLSRFDLSAALPVLSVTFIITILGTAFILHEPISLLRVIGIAVICLGVFLVLRS